MTSWLPDLSEMPGPRYRAIADRLAADVADGRLKPGERLPTHRDLAERIQVTIGTVTRAYKEAEQRGLIAGEVGRGTFVRAPRVDLPPPPAAADGFVDLARNYPVIDAHAGAIGAAIAAAASAPTLTRLLPYVASLGLAEHRAAGAAWIARSGLAARPDEVGVTDGAQHAMTLAMSALTRPGDVVLTEQLTFYGIKSIAALQSLRLHGVATDEHGLRPDALDSACRQAAPKALYCIPTLQNPTATVMPAARREEIAAICRRHAVAIVEDDIYGFLAPDAPPPLSRFAPEHSVYLTSLSKCIAPGLRVGFLRAPPAVLERIGAGLRATTYMATPIMAEVAARLIAGGEAARLARLQRDEAVARQAIAARLLAGQDFATAPTAFHLWLQLPEPWRREEFAEALRRRGVGVASAEAFAVGRAPVPHAARVCLQAARSRAELERALGTMAELLRRGPDRGAADI